MRRSSVPPTDRTPATSGMAHEQEQIVFQDRSILAEAQALSARLAVLNELVVAVQSHSTTDITAVLHTIMQQARWVLDFDTCTVVLHENGRYRAYGMRGTTFHEYALSEFVVQYGPLQNHVHFIPQRISTTSHAEREQSALSIPLYAAEKHIGTLQFYARPAYEYTLDDMRIGMALGLQAAAIVKNGLMVQSIERARDELGAILETIRDGVLVLSTSGRIMVCNQAMQRLIEVPPSDLIGQRFLQVFRRSQLLQTGMINRPALRELWQTIRGKSSASSFDSVSETLSLADGRVFEWASVPLFENNQIISYVLTWRDISTRVGLAQMQSDLTSMIVHDLRSPLTSLMLGLDILKNSQYDAKMWSETFGYMRQSATIMLEQINTMLEVSKLESGRSQLMLSICDIPELVASSVEPISYYAHINQQHILLNCAEPLPSLICDEGMIRRVMQNLLDNALKFAPLGSQIVVSVGFDGPHNQVIFSVRDHGPGVPAAYRQIIFEKFGQVKQPGYRRGTGLGLAFCRMAVEAHHGEIGVREAEGGGSEFWFTLPLLDEL